MEQVMMPECVRPDTKSASAPYSSVLRMRATEAPDNFIQAVNRVADGENPVILSQEEKDVAAIIHIEEFWLLESLIEQLEDDFYAEEAERRLNDPNEVPDPYEFAKI